MKPSPEIIAKAKSLHREGWSCFRIGAHLGLPTEIVHGWTSHGKRRRETFRTVSLRKAAIDRLQAEAERRGVSMASILHDLIEREIPA